MDRTENRTWVIDLKQAGREPKYFSDRIAGERQNIVRYDGRTGDEERFTYRLRIPDDDEWEERPPTRRQSEVIDDIYGHVPTFPEQVNHMMSAWFFAEDVCKTYASYLSSPRRKLVHVATAACILSISELSEDVRKIRFYQFKRPHGAAHPKASEAQRFLGSFVEALVADIRGAGAQVFG